MVRALAGDSTTTSRFPLPAPFPLPAAFLRVPAPLSPLSEAAVVGLPAALLLAGTLFPTSHPRHGPSLPPKVPSAAGPRNARPCRYPCNPFSRPDCSRGALGHIPVTPNPGGGSSPPRLAHCVNGSTIRGNGRV